MSEATQVETATAQRTSLPALIADGGAVTAIIPRNIDQMWRIAEIIVKSGMAPRDFTTKEKVCVAVMYGAEIGLSPMMALQRIAVINGRPSIWGEAVPGLALRTALVEDWNERVDGNGELMVATCRVKRKGIKSYTEKTFSVADARKAGLWGKAGPWTQYPKRMLTMRARVAFRDLFADALGGLYIAEELIGVDEIKEVAPAQIEPIRTIIGEATPLPPIVDQPEAKEPKAPLEGEIVPPAGKNPLPPLAKGPPITQDPEEVLKWIETRLASITEPADLGDAWETECAPKLFGMFPPDQEEANAIYRRHEKRLAR